tara:strand:+ start:541 stop:789 length:249 start_codon:yes stop_codon:yes gene_type:complete
MLIFVQPFGVLLISNVRRGYSRRAGFRRCRDLPAPPRHPAANRPDSRSRYCLTVTVDNGRNTNDAKHDQTRNGRYINVKVIH